MEGTLSIYYNPINGIGEFPLVVLAVCKSDVKASNIYTQEINGSMVHTLEKYECSYCNCNI